MDYVAPSVYCRRRIRYVLASVTVNRSHPGWLQTLWLSTLLKLSFFLSDLNNNFLNYTSVLSLQPTLLSTLALFLTNTFSPTKSLHFLNPLLSHRQLRCIRQYLDFKTAIAGLPPPLSILNLNEYCYHAACYGDSYKLWRPYSPPIVTKAPGWAVATEGINSKVDACEKAKHHTELFW